MLFKEITTKKFKSIMDNLYQKKVWIKIIQENSTLKDVDLFYECFEFCELMKNRFQFGNEDIDSPHLPFSIQEKDINYIHRDTWAATDSGEQIILYMKDGIQIFVEHNC